MFIVIVIALIVIQLYSIITVTVLLQEQPDVDLSNDHISFEGRGVGAHGDCVYKFSIKPYRHISPEVSICTPI